MGFPRTVRRTPVATDAVELTVSTTHIAPRYYDTVVFDDSADKRHAGHRIAGWVVERESRRNETREEAMDRHRAAVLSLRAVEPTTD